MIVTEDVYMSAPESKSIKGYIEGLQIIAKYLDEGEDSKFFCNAEHDVIGLSLSTETLPVDTEDGARLYALGFHPSSDLEYWQYFT